MKIIVLLLVILSGPVISVGQNIYIPDANFKSYLVHDNALSTNGVAEVQLREEKSKYNFIEWNFGLAYLEGGGHFLPSSWNLCPFRWDTYKHK